MATGLGLALLLLCLLTLRAQAAPFAAVVMDARTGQILHSVNHTTRLHPASLTKMMTLYVAFDAIRNGELTLDTMVRISRRAANEPPSRLGLREGQRIALRHLIRAAALRSGNDAATAIAEAVSGSVEAFARRMNRTAAAIGMSQTNFHNAHGLTQAGHLSSARDMTLLGRQLYFDFPEYYGIFARRSEDAGIAQVANTNSRFLDSYRGADGIKTGFTQAAGYNLTAMAERNGVRILVTVFGGRSIQHRHDQIVALMDQGFRAAPARVALRRPARPDYGRVASPRGAEGATARAPAQAAPAQAAPAGGRAAGRVIRLQTAPARSVFPRARPGAEPSLTAPSDALLAAVQSGVETALAASMAAQDPDLPDAAPVAAARVPPVRSPTPAARPSAVVARAETRAPAAADTVVDTSAAVAAAVAADLAAAREAGFTVVAPEALAAVTEARPEPRPDAEHLATDETAPPPEIAARLALAEPVPIEPDATEAPATLPARARQAPAGRPAGLAQAASPPSAPATQLAAPSDELAPSGEAVIVASLPATAAPAAADATAGATGEVVAVAAVAPADGQVVIPGLPAIPLVTAVTDAGDGESLALAPPANLALAAAPEPALPARIDDGPGLRVTEAGQIMWRHDDLLKGLDEVTEALTEPGRIVLTAEDMPTPQPAPPTVMPEIVVRVSSSGGQLWAVDLGRHGSRFDAERTLLRVALAESATLGGGVRRVAEGGGFRAMILGLTQDQAQRACLRLETVAQPCTVVDP